MTRRTLARALSVAALAGALVAAGSLAANAVSTITASSTGTVITSLPTFGAAPGVDDEDVVTDASHVYVADTGLDEVEVFSLDGTAQTPIAFAPGAGPLALALSPDGSKLYVAMVTGHQIGVVDLATRTTTYDPTTSVVPTAIAVSPNGATLYVVNNNDAQIYSYAAATGAAIAHSIANGVWVTTAHLTVSPDGTKVYATQRDGVPPNPGGGLRVLDAGTLTDLRDTPVLGATGLAVSPDGAHVYVGSEGAHEIVETDAGGVLTGRTAAAGFTPDALAVAPDGGTVYAGDFSNSFLSSVDTATFAATNAAAPGYGPVGSAHGLAVSPDGLHVYSAGGSAVYPFSVAKLTLTAPASEPVGTGSTPFAVRMTDGNASVADYSADTVTIDILNASNVVVASGSGSPTASTGLASIAVDLAALPAGTYSVRASFTGPSGAITATARSLVIVGVAPTLAATGLDGQLALLVGGIAIVIVLVGIALVLVRARRRRA